MAKLMNKRGEGEKRSKIIVKMMQIIILKKKREGTLSSKKCAFNMRASISIRL